MTSVVEGTLLWEPPEELRRQSNMRRYMDWLRQTRGLDFASYDELWRWSVDELEAFWASLWDYFAIRASQPYERVLASRAMPGAEWFPGARLNYSEHIFRHASGEHPALIFQSERTPLREISWAELERMVAAVAAGLRALGVGRGDRVVAYLPNIPEAIVALLASASLGAIWSSCSPDFGSPSVIDRFSQIEAKVLFAVDGYSYGGKLHDRRQVIDELQAALPTLEHIVVVPYLDLAAYAGNVNPGLKPGAIHDGERKNSGGLKPAASPAGSHGAATADTPASPIGPHSAADTGSTHVSPGETQRATSGPTRLAWGALLAYEGALSYEQVPFEHPLWVLYSSGTTGLPKPIVQGHGGIVLEHLKSAALHHDLSKGDRFFWFSTTGWMMWNFLVGGLLLGCTVVIYDGSPAWPEPDVLWRYAGQAGLRVMGGSAAYVAAQIKAGVQPARYDLSRLVSFASTGSPLAPEGFKWLYDAVKPDLWVASMSGGTDVCTAFLGASPLLPVHAGELQCRMLGCKVESFDEQGRPLLDEVGELVLTEPMPSMPIYFWNDAGQERYRESYFEIYPGVWRHGDWVKLTPRGSAVIYGRSDSTINRMGVRIGTSEIYRVVEGLPAVLDSLVIDLEGLGGAAYMPLFVVLKPGIALTPELDKAIKASIRAALSPRHVPDEIFAIAEVPRTLSGKKLEIPVKKILRGQPVEQAANPGSMSNPRSLDFFVQLAGRFGPRTHEEKQRT